MNKTLKVLKVIGKVFQWVFIVLIGIICFFSISMIVSKLTSKDKLATTFGYAILKVETGSMSPTINPNDVVIVKVSDSNEYNTGDVVAFWMSPSDIIPTIHRIVEINGEEVITKGDYEGNSNDPVKKLDDIVGKEVLTLPKFGYFVDFVRSPLGIITILVVGYILIEAPSIIKAIFKKEDKEEEKETN